MAAALAEYKTQPVQPRPLRRVGVQAPRDRQLKQREDLPVPVAAQLLRNVEEVVHVLLAAVDARLVVEGEGEGDAAEEKLVGDDADGEDIALLRVGGAFGGQEGLGGAVGRGEAGRVALVGTEVREAALQMAGW
jgi:hypothetical protein